MTVEETKKKIVTALFNDGKCYKHKHNIFVGANTTGKSNMLASIVKGLSDKSIPVYYICPWNRKIVNKRTELQKTFKNLSVQSIVQTRLNEKFFNQDVFMDELGTELVTNELYMNTGYYTELFQDFLCIAIGISNRGTDLVEEQEDLLEANGKKFEELSDSQISMMRMLMEINYAYEQKCNYVIIDEVDINLDHINSSGFLEYLKRKYQEICFIVSAHSLYTILGLNDYNVIKIVGKYFEKSESLCELYDSNDLDNVEIIDKKLFADIYKINKLDDDLGNYLRLVFAGEKIEKEELNCLIKNNKLSIRQQIVLDYLKKKLGE